MKATTNDLVIQMLVYGIVLAILKLIYLFFDFYNILDFVVFTIAGFVLGSKIPSNRWAIGLLLSLPAIALCLLFVLNLGYSNIIIGIGTAYAISLILIPLATVFGILLKHRHQKLSKKVNV